ncbi:MAG: hypothetical protein EOM12_03940 [Verrucomicrobiae bacterium]|nr:hypothetical protein [Verrucomicrobiae bacterium]
MSKKERFIESSAALNDLIAAERALTCPECDAKWDRARGSELLEKLGEWWLSEDTQNELGMPLALRVHAKTPDLQNMGVVFCVMQSDGNTIPVFLYEIQHEYPGKTKPGLHYQLQVPHGDVGKNLNDAEKKRAIARVWNRFDEQMEIYRSDDQFRSIKHGKALGNLADIQAIIIELARELAQAFE